MIKVFISQPMRGKTSDEIWAAREKAVASVKHHFADQDVEVIESYTPMNDPGQRKTPALYYLGNALQLMATADVAFFVKGWEQHRGCRIENACALEYGVTVIEDYTED